MQPLANMDKRLIRNRIIQHKFDRKIRKAKEQAEKEAKEKEKER